MRLISKQKFHFGQFGLHWLCLLFFLFLVNTKLSSLHRKRTFSLRHKAIDVSIYSSMFLLRLPQNFAMLKRWIDFYFTLKGNFRTFSKKEWGQIRTSDIFNDFDFFEFFTILEIYYLVIWLRINEALLDS